MDELKGVRGSWKQRLTHELIEYWSNFLYLAVFFGVFTWYRRLILAEVRVSYLDYGVALIEALVLAKVIIIGGLLGIGNRREGKPLAYTTLVKSLLFTLWVILFKIVENTAIGLLEGKGVLGGIAEFHAQGRYEILARCLVIFTALIPFFAFKELGNILGEGKMFALFFRKRAA
jgi:hypothetical protein